MSKYSICILDDKIPAERLSEYMDDTSLLNSNNFKHLLTIEKSNWGDISLYNLVNTLKKQKKYDLFGFTQHSFFFDYIDDNIFSPDIIIFDWNMGENVKEKDSKRNLLKLLKSKYCLVAIFTEADKQDEVTQIIKSNGFSDYKERLFLIKKDDENSVEKLKTEIEDKLKLFSFKLNKTLKRNTLQSIDNILINIGKLSFNQFVSLFGEDSDNNKKVLAATDFIDVFLEKLKYELTTIGIEEDLLKVDNEDTEDINIVRKLWHFRLYHKSQDNIIRKGDILKKENKYFLVLSSDCHLDEFWNKSLGSLAILKLHKVLLGNESFKKRLNYRKNDNLDKYELSSLVNPPSSLNFLSVLPSLDFDENEYIDFAVNPRELSSIQIDLLIEGNAKRKLTIDDMTGYEKYLSLSEPFLSGLYLFITQNFSGYGLPDFSIKLQESIKDNFKKLKK